MIAPNKNNVPAIPEDPAEDPRLKEIRRQRTRDWDLGFNKGQELFKEGSLGRLGENEDIKRVLEARRQGLQGFTPQEQAALRSKMMTQLSGANQGALRQLRSAQGASGISGAAAGAQVADVLRGGQQAAIAAERDLQMQNILQRRQALGELESSALGIGKFDIGQANKEKMGATYTGLGEQMLGSAERSGLSAKDIAEQQRQVANDGGKK